MVTEYLSKGYIPDVLQDEKLTKEELKKLDLEEEKAISKKECDENNINISLIAFKELEIMGFDKSDISTLFLSKLVEDVYHERKLYDSSDYFDLSMKGNEHYKNLYDYYKLGNEDSYRVLIAAAIWNSNCETKNINDIVYGVSKSINKDISKQKKINTLIA